MTPMVNHKVKYFIIRTLHDNIFSSHNKARKDFIVGVHCHVFSIIEMRTGNHGLMSMDTWFFESFDKNEFLKPTL